MDTEEVEEGRKVNIIKENDPTKDMNRKQIREYGRILSQKAGCFTKPSLASRTRKRRTVKKVGNATRKAAR